MESGINNMGVVNDIATDTGNMVTRYTRRDDGNPDISECCSPSHRVRVVERKSKVYHDERQPKR